MRRPSAAAVLLAACCALSGCAGSGRDDDGGGPKPPACRPPDEPSVLFSANIQPFLQTSCAVGGCHLGPVPAQQLDLSTGRAYGETVNVRSTEVPQLLVDPGKPDDSYLLRKAETAAGIVGEPMPPPGCPTPPRNAAVCPTDGELAALRQWITECAPDN